MEFSGPVGEALLQKLHSEQVVWFTTVNSRGVPQPRLVWFVWDGAEIVVYSQPNAWKVRHIRTNPNVAVHFNSDPFGDNFQVIIGKVRIDGSAPLVIDLPPYLEKYREGIHALDMDEESYSRTFSTAIRVRPVYFRGLDPI